MASLPIIVKYLLVFLISMVPIVELRGAIPIAEGLGFKKGSRTFLSLRRILLQLFS